MKKQAAVTPLTDAERDQLILSKVSMAKRFAGNFHRKNKYPLEVEELESEALAVLVEAGRDYDPRTTMLPFGAYAAQKILWRLNDFIQAWYRLSRQDFCRGEPDKRRMVPILESSVRDPKATDPAKNLYLEDCQRLVLQLTPRQRELLDLRYRKGKNLLEISKLLKMTHIRARQIHCEVMQSLRRAMNGEKHEPKAAC